MKVHFVIENFHYVISNLAFILKLSIIWLSLSLIFQTDKMLGLHLAPYTTKANHYLWPGFIELDQSIFLLVEKRLIHGHLFEGTFNLHPLCPGHCWIGQTVPTIATATHVYSLFVKEAECLSHHVDSIVGERWGILKDRTINKAYYHLYNHICQGWAETDVAECWNSILVISAVRFW